MNESEKILICRDNAPRNAIRLLYKGMPHACPMADCCHCHPLELTAAEFESAQRGHWPDRVLSILNEQVI